MFLRDTSPIMPQGTRGCTGASIRRLPVVAEQRDRWRTWIDTERREGEARVALSYPGRMLIARAITRMATTSDTADSTIMVIFAQILSGRVSVGLNAVAAVNDR